jgi:Flp pilus assembly protein TadG
MRAAVPGRGGESGAAVVEFVLVAVLLTVLFLGILQLALALHVRNTLVASAAEGARYAANADRTPADGVRMAKQVIRDALADSYADDVTAGYETVGGVATVYVEVRATLPVVGMLGPARALVVRGHALEEGP